MGKHRRLAAQVNETITSFEHLVSGETPTKIEDLSRARLVLVQCVDAYIVHLGSLVVGADKDARLQPWKDAHSKVVSLRSRYSQHIGRFSAAKVSTDWPAYRQGSETLIVAMREHLAETTAWHPID